MVFSRFIWTILILVVLIVVTSVYLGIYLQKPEYPVTGSVLGVILILETVYLVYYLTRIRRDLLRLINALRNEDPTLQFSREREDPYFSAIHKGFNEIIRNFRLVRLDKEAEHSFFESTVNHVQFGLIAFNTDGNVELVNETFRDLFQTREIENIEDLAAVSDDFPARIRQLSHQKETLERIYIGGTQYHLIFLASKFRLRQEEITLISVRDISREIDRNELEAWQKLMRILRHEILNSISPIKLLSANLSDLLQKDGKTISMETLTTDEINTIKIGFETIHRRATGLSNFLDAYSNLYRMPELKLERINIPGLLERITSLLQDQFTDAAIFHSIDCPDTNLEIEMDERMIEQVLINLIKNALEALRSQDQKSLTLAGKIEDGNPVIAIEDNGIGIPEDQIDSIFIPFYSTREEGSGIGLSFSQHVMRLHQGRINVISNPGKGSEFQLVFK